MKKKRIILASILGAAALFAGASIVTAVVSNNANRIQENVNDGIEESDLAEDSVFGTGIESIIVNKEVKKKESTDALLTPVIGRQYAYDSTTGKVSIRFIAAVSSLDVDAVWRRTLYNSDGSVNRTGIYKSTKAYTTLAYKYKNDKNEDVTETQTAEEFAGKGYNYFVLYTLKNIPISDCSSIEASLEISNDAYTEVSKTGSVATTSTADISSYEASLTIDGNYSYKASSNTSAGNGQYINGKLKTIYSTNDTSLNTDYISLGLTKTYTNTTESSNYYYNDSDFSQRISFSGFSQTAGAHTIKVQCGATAASYDIYVLATDCAYQDANNNYVVTVDKSYTGIIGAVSGTNGNMFTTISQALEFLQNDTFVPTNANKILNIGAGYYKEKLEITTPNLTIKGSGTLAKGTYSSDENYNATDYAKATIIEYDTLFGQDAPGLSDVNYKHTTDSTQTVAIRESAINCKINGVTISNAWNCTEYFTAKGVSSERALALLVQADAFQMNNCALLGYQDTLELMTGRQYFNACYISGKTDYIFGTNNITLFNACTIHTIESNGFVTAFKGYNKGDDNPNYATVFNSCTFEGDSSVTGTALGRPWGAYANVAFISCTMSSAISTEAYDDKNEDTQGKRYVKMNAEPTDSTVNFVEYGNTGDGAILTEVAGMSMLDADTAKNYYTYSTLFGKTNGNVSFALAWDPVNGYEQDNNIYHIFHGSAPTTGTSYEYDGTNANSTFTKNGITYTNCWRRTGNDGDDLAVSGSISFDVEAGTTVTINSYPGYHYYKIGDVYADSDTVSYYFATAQTVTLNHTGSTFYLYSIVINKTLAAPETAVMDSISISGQPTSNIQVGNDYDLSNLKVKAHYSDGTYRNVTSYTTDAETAIDKTKAGEYTVTVTYNDGTTEKTAQFTVTYVATIDNTINETIGTSFKGNKYSSYSNVIPTSNTFDASSSEVVINKMTYYKIKSNGSATNWAVFENGGYVVFDVGAACTLRIAYYNAASKTNTTVKLGNNVITSSDSVSSEGAVCAYGITSAGTVTLSFTGGGYLGMIQVDMETVPQVTSSTISTDTGLVFHGDSITGMTNVIKWSNNQKAGTQNAFTISGSNLSNSGYLEFKNDDTISFDVAFDNTQYDCLLTVSCYNDKTFGVTVDSSAQTVSKNENASTSNAYIYESYLSKEGTVQISSTSEQNYLNYITITFISKS